VPFWFAGMALFSLRGVLGWVATRRLRRSPSICSTASAWQSRLTALANQLGIAQAVVLVESRLVDVPMVAGFLRPVILLHELAHIRRFDYVMNLLQTAIEALLFYHPAVWWVSNTLRQQREHCCDDIVLSTGADPGLYATTLHSLEQARPRLAMAATGGAPEARIRRILGVPGKPGLSTAPLLVVFSLAAAFLAAQTAPQQSYSKWLNEEVQYIIKNDERQAFQSLQSDNERTRFIEQFWLRRGPAAQQEHYRRLAYTAAHFGPKTDRARIYITYGPPDEIDSHPQGDATVPNPWEEWRYRYIAGMGDHVKILFSDVGRAGQFPMTMSPPAKLTPLLFGTPGAPVSTTRSIKSRALTSAAPLHRSFPAAASAQTPPSAKAIPYRASKTMPYPGSRL
jgi:GWxTD domain-containing protein